ncbi:hypothetical protein IL306_003889 [Fusarium sp. DS 682]|nr:hypothetical protein IL306_003889 [Fusarium sp. DS 682]
MDPGSLIRTLEVRDDEGNRPKKIAELVAAAAFDRLFHNRYNAQSPKAVSQDLPTPDVMSLSDLIPLEMYFLPSDLPQFKYSDDDAIWNFAGRKNRGLYLARPLLFSIPVGTVGPGVVFHLEVGNEYSDDSSSSADSDDDKVIPVILPIGVRVITGPNDGMEDALDNMLVPHWHKEFESKKDRETEDPLPPLPFLRILIYTSANIWDKEGRLDEWMKENEDRIEINHFFCVFDAQDTEHVWGHDFSWIVEASLECNVGASKTHEKNTGRG